jgi:hypothetical protein
MKILCFERDPRSGKAMDSFTTMKQSDHAVIKGSALEMACPKQESSMTKSCTKQILDRFTPPPSGVPATKSSGE